MHEYNANGVVGGMLLLIPSLSPTFSLSCLVLSCLVLSCLLLFSSLLVSFPLPPQVLTPKIAKVDPMAMTWKITGTNDTDSKGNLHTKATITSDAPNGAHVEVYCESWSKGMTTPYGSLTNVISPDEVEV